MHKNVKVARMLADMEELRELVLLEPENVRQGATSSQDNRIAFEKILKKANSLVEVIRGRSQVEEEFDRIVWMLTFGCKYEGAYTITLFSNEDKARNKMNETAGFLNNGLNAYLNNGGFEDWEAESMSKTLHYHRVNMNRWESESSYIAIAAIGVEE